MNTIPPSPARAWRHRLSQRAQFVLLAGAYVFLAPGSAAPPASASLRETYDAGLCREAVIRATSMYPVPDGLLGAIATTESGRPDPATGSREPWPWTINADGQGRFFASREEAIAAVRQLQANGVRSIDVGCMQINLMHHPDAFASLEDAFDPQVNADYAARFLMSLYVRASGWMEAAMAYHSLTPAFAVPYGERVAAEWGQPGGAAAGAAAGLLRLALPLSPRFSSLGAPSVNGFVFDPETTFPVALPQAFRASVPAARARSVRVTEPALALRRKNSRT